MQKEGWEFDPAEDPEKFEFTTAIDQFSDRPDPNDLTTSDNVSYKTGMSGHVDLENNLAGQNSHWSHRQNIIPKSK